MENGSLHVSPVLSCVGRMVSFCMEGTRQSRSLSAECQQTNEQLCEQLRCTTVTCICGQTGGFSRRKELEGLFPHHETGLSRASKYSAIEPRLECAMIKLKNINENYICLQLQDCFLRNFNLNCLRIVSHHVTREDNFMFCTACM